MCNGPNVQFFKCFSHISAYNRARRANESFLKRFQWNRHYLLYLDEQKNADFGQIVDRFLVKIGVATMVPYNCHFFQNWKKKLASDRARRLNETCLKPPSAALSRNMKIHWICLVCQANFGHIAVRVWSKNWKKNSFFLETRFWST